ncbi:hypothetical protein RhiirB3_416496 [Rhizophagus irregularis]|nr:hypothetical protein RhiirB3_416496 [Rhizophagus irregularis]
MSNLTVTPSGEGRQTTIFDTFKSFTKDNLSHEVRRNLSKLDPRLPEDLKNITLYLKEEKNVLTSLQNAANERREASKYIYVWGRDMGEDIADVTEKLADLLTKISDVEIVLTEKYEHYRNIIKEIRAAEERLIVHKERKRKINDEIHKISKSHPRSPRIPELEADLKMVIHDSLADETEVGNIVRKKFKEAMALHLNATFEASEKIAIISGFGWDLIEQIDPTPIKPGESREYKGREISSQAIKDCQIALHRWQPSPSEVRPLLPALTNTAPAQLATQKAEYEAKISQITGSMTALKDEHDTQVADFAKSLENQKQEYEKRINEFVAALAAQKDGYEAQLNDLSAALQAEKGESDSKIDALNAALEAEKQASEKKVNEISTALENSKKQHEEQLRQYNLVISQKQEYEVALRERDSIISKLQADVNSVATEKGKLSQVVKELEETLKSKSTTIDQKEDKISKLEDDISSIKDQLSGLKISSPDTTQLSNPSSGNTRQVVGNVPVSGEGSKEETLSRSDSNATDQGQVPLMSGQYQPGGFGHPPPPPQGYYGQQYYQQQPYYQQQFYQQGQPPFGGYQQQQPPPGQFGQAGPTPQPPGNFVGGFFLGPPDEAPPAYDGPPKEGFPEDKKD